MITGEFVHGLRSSLDLLVWQPVLANGGDPTTFTTAFPVVIIKKSWKSGASKAAGPGKKTGVTEDALRLIERLQPYHIQPPNDPFGHPRKVIHNLDIRDKHHVLSVVGCALRHHDMAIGGPGEHVHIESAVFGGPQLISPLKDGEEIYLPIDPLCRRGHKSLRPLFLNGLQSPNPPPSNVLPSEG